MIARVWKSAVRAEDVEAYSRYVEETGLSVYRQTPGNRGAWILTRDLGDRTEFITLSFWDDLDVIAAFGGDDIDRAVYYPEDDRYLLERLDTVEHFEMQGDGMTS